MRAVLILGFGGKMEPPDQNLPNLRQPWLQSEWCRRCYRVEGEYLKPDPSSPLQRYNPFGHFIAGSLLLGGRTKSLIRTKKARVERSLYLELAQLGTLCDRRERRGVRNADAMFLAAVEEFTNTYGPLGLLHHHLLQVRYVPGERGGIIPKHNPPFGHPQVVDGPNFREVVPALPELDFTDEAIHEEIVRQGWGRSLADGTLIILGGPDKARDYDEAWDRAVASLRQRCWVDWLSDHATGGLVDAETPLFPGYVSHTVEEYFGYFFPDLRHKQQDCVQALSDLPEYPALTSDAFWDHYCEHLMWFEVAVREFRRAVDVVIRWEITSDDDADWLKHQFDRHLRHVQPIPVIKGGAGGERSLGFFFPSLLSAAYMMLLLDFTQNRSLRYCANEPCGRPFAADRPDQMYCDGACKTAQIQREYRRRKKRMALGDTRKED